MADGNAPNRILLRKILYRIDFQLITEKMHEEIFEFVSQEFGDFFSNQRQELENSIEVEVNPAQMEAARINPKAQPVFAFYQPHTPDCDGRQLKIGRTFLFLEVTLNVQTMGISYYELVSKIVKKMSEYPMFRLSRIGLRKFNSFYILDSKKDFLDKIFLVNYLSEAKHKDFLMDSFENAQMYLSQPYTLRFSRQYSSGSLVNEQRGIRDELAHMIAFDFDLFTMDIDEMSVFVSDAKAGLEKMNGLIYDFFQCVIREEIIEKINKGDLLEDYNIIPFC